MAVVYVVVASALSVTSHLLDARLKTPTGLTRTFYEGSALTGIVRGQQVTTDIDLAFLDADPSLPRRFFGVTWEGVWYRPTDQWVDLYGSGDDVVVVKLDDEVVLERNAPLGKGERMQRFLLKAGRHRLLVVHEQYGGDYLLNLSVADAGAVPAPLDPESLFPKRPSLKAIAANHRLLVLRRTVLAVWLVPPLAAFVWAAWPWTAARMRGLYRTWARRSRDNWSQALSAPMSASPSRRASAAIGALYVLVAVVFVASIWRFHEPQTGFTRLISFGEQFDEQALPAVRILPHHVDGGSGYDGQFYAQLALEPLVRNPALRTALDSVQYRARRILTSWTAFVLGAGRPFWILQAYALQNVGFWLLLGGVLLRWLPPVSVRNWLAWCGCLLGAGAIASVRLALTDLPSATLVALGLAAGQSGRCFMAGGLLGLSGLARETNLLAVFGVDALGSWRAGRRARAVVSVVLVLLPLFLWLGYLWGIFGAGAWSSGDRNLTLPFAGLAAYLGHVAREVQFNGPAALPLNFVVAVFSLGVQAFYLAWRVEWYRPWWRVGIAYAALMMLLGVPVLEGNPGAFVRVLLPMTLAYNVLLPNGRWFWPLLLLGNLTVVQGLQILWLS